MKIKCLSLIFLSIFFLKCATPASVRGMTVTDFKSDKQIINKIYVKPSTGGSITLPFWISTIPNDNFTEALKESLIQSNVVSEITNLMDENWILEIKIISVDQPYFGLTFTVKTIITYKLYYKNEPVFEKTITESGSATVEDSFIGIIRLRLANEVSAKNNIRSLLQSLKVIDKDKFK